MSELDHIKQIKMSQWMLNEGFHPICKMTQPTRRCHVVHFHVFNTHAFKAQNFHVLGSEVTGVQLNARRPRIK